MKLSTAAIVLALSMVALAVTITPPLQYPVGGGFERRAGRLALPYVSTTTQSGVEKRTAYPAAITSTKPNPDRVPDEMGKRTERTLEALAKRATTPDPLKEKGKFRDY
ncbi:hypothetical protein BGZ96_010847 [Linnemannia gamsii]|uniref:Uncharacterized protein n=1 Tax=Linnemannia gamsii TaxID=64522 RepID=A0ABQ7KDJ5_9FUNG|nr:hypothetical protein BGZ96_010847 [Linnemannia gamsii]